MSDASELRGRVAVITGAGSGFGREFARLAAARGMKRSGTSVPGATAPGGTMP